MWPVLYSSKDGLTAYTYGACILLAFSLAYMYVHSRSRPHGINPERLLIPYMVAAVGGVLGSRVLTMVTTDLPQILQNPASALSMNGLTYYGGVIGGTAAVLLAGRVQGVNGWKLIDVGAPALMIGLTVGRLGCFFAGCCHGAPIQLSQRATPLLGEGVLEGQIWLDTLPPFLATEFSAGVGRYLHEPLYPTQIWSVVVGGLLIALLAWLLEHKQFDGQVAAVMFVLEPIGRFGIESFRGDERGLAFGIPVEGAWSHWLPAGWAHAGGGVSEAAMIGLTTSQVIGVLLMALGGLIWWMRRRTPLGSTVLRESDAP